MRFEQGVVKQVMHAAFRWYGFYNLPRHMVEHWTCVHEFNRLLVIWLNYKEMDKRVQRRILNPMATLFLQSNQEEVDNTIKVENTFEEEKKVPIPRNDLEKEKDWVATGRVFYCYRSGTQDSTSRHENMCSILAELVEDEINCKEKKKEENEKKAYAKEIATLQ